LIFSGFPASRTLRDKFFLFTSNICCL
jgi:hypothetical protein